MRSKENEAPKIEAKAYPAAALLKSKALSDYQPDFARAVLTEPEYTIEGAKAVLDKALKKEVK